MDQTLTHSCAIVDDEPLAIKVLENHIAKVPGLKLVKTFENAMEALDLLRTCKTDLLFLDIQMPGLSGLQLIKTFAARPAIILTTAHSQYAVEGFELGVTDYLLKPITFERFIKAVNRAIGVRFQSAVPAPELKVNEFIFLKMNRDFHKVFLKDICFIEAAGNFVMVHLAGKRLLVSGKISDYATMLMDKGFVRVHKSFIVSLDHILQFGHNRLFVGQTEIPVSESYQHGLSKWRESNHKAS
jgi:two-component system LytT family response regulator